MKTCVAKVQSPLSEILHKAFIDDPRPDTPTVKALSQALDMHWNTLYKVFRGEQRFVLTPEELPDLYQKLGRPLDMLKWLVTKCDPSCRVIRMMAAAGLDGEVVDENENIVMKSAEAIKGNRAAMEDGRWDESEIKAQIDIYLDIIAEANHAIQELETIRRQRNDRERAERPVGPKL